jgi:flagellar motor switch protein FliG
MTTIDSNESSATAAEYSKMTKVQKLAAFLLFLTPENSVQIMKSLDEDVLEQVASEMTKITNLSQELQTLVLQEFSPVAVDAGSSVAGGAELTHKLLEKSVGLFRASDIMGRVSPVRAPVAAIQHIIDMDPRRIFNLLRHEQPQTIAMLLSYLTPDKASQVLSLLRPEIRDEIIERVANLAPTTTDVVEDVVEVLHRNSGTQRVRTVNQTGGVKMAAEVLNALPRTVSKSIVGSLSERNSELGEAIRQKMFTFEDLGRMDVRMLQKIMQTVDTRTLTVALRAVSEKLKNTLLSAISKRAADNVRDELEMMEPVKLKEIETAQLEIVAGARRLESDGEIDLNDLG